MNNAQAAIGDAAGSAHPDAARRAAASVASDAFLVANGGSYTLAGLTAPGRYLAERSAEMAQWPPNKGPELPKGAVDFPPNGPERRALAEQYDIGAQTTSMLVRAPRRLCLDTALGLSGPAASLCPVRIPDLDTNSPTTLACPPSCHTLRA
jgi:hypothetical protein